MKAAASSRAWPIACTRRWYAAPQQQELAGQPAILLVPAQLRSWLARMVRHTIPSLRVLAYEEVPDNKQVKVIASVGQ